MTAPLYTKITGDVTNQVLITKGGDWSGDMKYITVVNSHASNKLTISMDLYDGSTVVADLISLVVIPAGTLLSMTDAPHMRFNSKKYSLRVTTTGSANCTIIIK